MKLWLVLPGTLLIAIFALFVFTVAIASLAQHGGSSAGVDMSIYSPGDRLLLRRHLLRLTTYKVMTMAFPFACLFSVAMLWVGYAKDQGAVYYWFFLLPVAYTLLLFIVDTGFETRAHLAFRPSHHVIGRQFFKCEANRRLEGGNYGKGPMDRFGPYFCRGWIEIDEQEFKSLAMKWHGVKLD